jgi:hypothetical protein
MSASTVTRKAPVTEASGDELTLPADIARILGKVARIEVGPGPVVTLRPGQLQAADLAAAVAPVTSIDQLIKSKTPLTEAERTALYAYLYD